MRNRVSQNFFNHRRTYTMIIYQTDLQGIDWETLKQDLVDDDFDNGRSNSQLRLSFENSTFVIMASINKRCVASGRLLSDRVGNAYVVDVWTLSQFRRQGIASEIMKKLIDCVPGQHIYLQTEDAVDFYKKLGFKEQPVGMSTIAGEYLQNDSIEEL
jgi:GNAT superfamily N-acetyltransferase